jgi:hypothetical protein
MSTPPVPVALPETASVGSEQAPASIIANHNVGGDERDSQPPRNQTAITPEPRPDMLAMNDRNSQTTPSTPGLLPPFDWEDFQARYEKALADADDEEREILKEFESLTKVWFALPSNRNPSPLTCETLVL